MHGIYYNVFIQAYVAFLVLIFLFLTANTLVPKKRMHYNARGHRPKVLVIVPCRGTDIAMDENLKAAKGQSYKNYDVIAVAHSKNDSSIAAIRKTKTRFIVADFRCRNCSGKVRNIATALSKFRNYDAYVILDSDVLVGRKWLEKLVAPLSDKRIGASTAFPVFEPVGGFWSRVKHAWGFVGQGLMENGMTRFGWGGSLAFRKDLLDKNDFAYFSDSISDDIALTRIAKRKGLKIAYVAEANPVVRSDDSFSQFIEWSNRQAALSIAGSRRVLHYGVAFYSLSILLLLSSIVLSVFASALFLILLLPFALGAIKLYLKSGRHAYMLGIYFMIDFIYLYNIIKASMMRTIRWRGSSYDLAKISNGVNR